WIAADALDRDGGGPHPPNPPLRHAVGNALCGVPKAPRNAAEGVPYKTPRREAPAILPRRVPWRVRWFTKYFKRYLTKNFHAARLSRTGAPPVLDGTPLVVVLNHASWWDPLMGMALADLFAGYKHFVPIDAEQLKRYRLFEP